ncbi:hypothetical protein FYK55_13180 [Roseiconus nitratireducens]|uniref:Uncharacterized protein n=1 Tax=Roseiconus nitratireducens TaxID=2605748 RepID=A0A5M6D765_9BACT|nr:hypothetical protein [Roseiconus nitratireducens]KAA5543223.1 hypothetical protein FYK55_13180 [Roseiconus nitratireducens]
MRFSCLIVVLLACTAGVARCEETAKTDDAATATPFGTQFLVTLAEYHLEEPIPVDATEVEILDSVRDSGAVPVESVRMTATEDTESMAHFGQRVTVTTGKVIRGPVTSKQTESIEIGTMLRVRVASHAKGALAEIDYSTSRLNGAGTDDSPPDVVTNTVQATQLYVLGKQRLLSTSSTGKAPCIVVSIQRIP